MQIWSAQEAVVPPTRVLIIQETNDIHTDSVEMPELRSLVLEDLPMVNKDVAAVSSVKRKIFLMIVVVYSIAWVFVSRFIYRVFGIGYMIGLSIILVFPAAVSFDLISRRRPVRRREVGFVVTLAILATGAAVGVVRHGYDTGMDQREVEQVEYAQFRRALRSDPTFDDVVLYVSPKNSFIMRGGVATRSDLSRLESFAAKCRAIRWNVQVEVTGHPGS